MSVPKQTFGGRLYNTFQKKYLDNTLYNMMIVKPFFSCDIKHKLKIAYFNVKSGIIKKLHFLPGPYLS